MLLAALVRLLLSVEAAAQAAGYAADAAADATAAAVAPVRAVPPKGGLLTRGGRGRDCAELSGRQPSPMHHRAAPPVAFGCHGCQRHRASAVRLMQRSATLYAADVAGGGAFATAAVFPHTAELVSAADAAAVGKGGCDDACGGGCSNGVRSPLMEGWRLAPGGAPHSQCALGGYIDAGRRCRVRCELATWRRLGGGVGQGWHGGGCTAAWDGPPRGGDAIDVCTTIVTATRRRHVSQPPGLLRVWLLPHPQPEWRHGRGPATTLALPSSRPVVAAWAAENARLWGAAADLRRRRPDQAPSEGAAAVPCGGTQSHLPPYHSKRITTMRLRSLTLPFPLLGV